MSGTERQDFNLRVNDSVDLRFTLRDSAGALQDLTGASFKWSMRVGTQELTVLDGAIDKTNVATGVVIVPVPGSLTATVTPGLYDHALQVTNGGKPFHAATGRVRLRRDGS